MPQKNGAANQSKSGASVDYKYGCLLNQKEVKSTKYMDMLLHVSILQLSVGLEEYRLNKVKNISTLYL